MFYFRVYEVSKSFYGNMKQFLMQFIYYVYLFI